MSVLKVDRIIKEKGIGARKLAMESGIAYNTALSYSRDASDRISKDILEKIADTLEVEVFELFLGDNEARAIRDIAATVGVDVSPGRSFSDILSDVRGQVVKE